MSAVAAAAPAAPAAAAANVAVAAAPAPQCPLPSLLGPERPGQKLLAWALFDLPQSSQVCAHKCVTFYR